MRSSALTIQARWRGYIQRKYYETIKQGFMRLQAVYQARLLAHRYNILRNRITNLQRYCRKYLATHN